MNNELIQTALYLVAQNEKFFKNKQESMFEDMYHISFTERTAKEFEAIVLSNEYLEKHLSEQAISALYDNSKSEEENEKCQNDYISKCVEEISTRPLLRMWGQNREVYSFSEEQIDAAFSKASLRIDITDSFKDKLIRRTGSQSAFLIDFSANHKFRAATSASGAIIKLNIFENYICARTLLIFTEREQYQNTQHTICSRSIIDDDKKLELNFADFVEKDETEELPYYVIAKLILLTCLNGTPSLFDNNNNVIVHECTDCKFESENDELSKVIAPQYPVNEDDLEFSVEVASGIRPKFRDLNYDKAHEIAFEYKTIDEEMDLMMDDPILADRILEGLPDPDEIKQNTEEYNKSISTLITRMAETDVLISKDTLIRLWEQKRVVYEFNCHNARVYKSARIHIQKNMFDTLPSDVFFIDFADDVFFDLYGIDGLFVYIIKRDKENYEVFFETDYYDIFAFNVPANYEAWVDEHKSETLFKYEGDLKEAFPLLTDGKFRFLIMKILVYICQHQDMPKVSLNNEYGLTKYANLYKEQKNKDTVLVYGGVAKDAHPSLTSNSVKSRPDDYLPLVISRYITENTRKLNGYDASVINAVMKWSQNKQVYIFDNEFLNELLRTENISLSKGIFDYMPYQHFYIDISSNEEARKTFEADGMFISKMEEENTYAYIGVKKEDDAIRVCQPWKSNLDFAERIEDTAENFKKNFENDEIEMPKFGFLLVQILSYLCSVDPDIRTSPKSHYQAPKNGKVRNKISEVRIWDVGVRFGTAYRKWQTNKTYEQDPATKGTGSKKRPHSRRAHWSHYWYKVEGSDEKVKRPKWIYEIMVGTGNSVTTIHKVKDDKPKQE